MIIMGRRMLFLFLLPLILGQLVHHSASGFSRAVEWNSNNNNPTTYHYFAIGSNMCPATMTSLRSLQPVSASAAVLPDYELAFDIPGNPLIEPSAASVRPAGPPKNVVVHGVLYELSERDFGRLGASEGVPWAYRWEECRVIPYVGDGADAGRDALQAATAETNKKTGTSSATADAAAATTNTAGTTVQAYVLTASPLLSLTTTRWGGDTKMIPPSRSYLRVLQEGAAYWQMDRDYQQQLSQVPVSQMAPGVSWQLLQAAIRLNPTTGSS